MYVVWRWLFVGCYVLFGTSCLVSVVGYVLSVICCLLCDT